MIKRQRIDNEWPLFIGFFIWPLLGFILSLREVGKRSFTIIFILFYFLYGFTYVIAGKDQDTYRIAQYFRDAGSLSFSDLINKIGHLYAVGNKPDVFQDFLQFLVSRFTDNVQVYLAVTAVLFAFVSTLIFQDILKQNERIERLKSIAILALFFLFMVLSPSRINSFRHYFATAVFLLSLNRYLNGKGIKYLFLLLFTPFVHFGFIMVIPLIFVYKIVGSRLAIYYVFVVLSFIFSDQVSETVGEYATSLDESALQYHASKYTSEIYVKRVEELQSQRYYLLDKYINFTTIFFLFFGVYQWHFIRNKNAEDLVLRNLYAMTLLIFAFVNLFSGIESVSNRFGVLYQGFCCIFFMRLYMTAFQPVPLFWRSSFLVVLIVNSAIALRILIQSASVSTVLLFFPVSIYSPIELSILEWIK